MSRAGFSNGLTAEEIERLALLSEECAEVIQVIGKIQRHGFESVNPRGDPFLTNRNLLENELGDVDAAISLLHNRSDIRASKMMAASRRKLAKLPEWLHMKANLQAVEELLLGKKVK